jgi:hypothetical protein
MQPPLDGLVEPSESRAHDGCSALRGRDNALSDRQQFVRQIGPAQGSSY